MKFIMIVLIIQFVLQTIGQQNKKVKQEDVDVMDKTTRHPAENILR